MWLNHPCLEWCVWCICEWEGKLILFSIRMSPLLIMLVVQSLQGKGCQEERGGESSFSWSIPHGETLPGKAGHLIGSCIIITWKWYVYGFILKWPLLKDKDTQLERTRKINKNRKWQILGFSSCSHIHRFFQMSLSWEFLPKGVSQFNNSNNKEKILQKYSLTCFFSLWMNVLWDSTRS